MKPTPFEEHEHCWVSGPNAHRSLRVVHSHQDGEQGHQHINTGPASYTIDKDEWRAATGMRGGGRKKYTKTPSGPQLERVELEDWQRTFTVVFDGNYTSEHERNKISLADWTAQRDTFIAAERAQKDEQRQQETLRFHGGPAVPRMALTFDLEPIYVYQPPRSSHVQVPLELDS